MHMADRLFSKEGLSTTVNRDSEANRIVTSINGAQNRLSPHRQGVQTPDLENVFDPVIGELQQMTIEAHTRGDKSWVSDCIMILEHVAPYIHIGDRNKVLRMLIKTVRDAWQALEDDSGVPRPGVGANIRKITGGFLGKIGQTLQTWGKKLGS